MGELAAQVGYNRGDGEDEGERSMAADGRAYSSRIDSQLEIGRPPWSDAERREGKGGWMDVLVFYTHL